MNQMMDFEINRSHVAYRQELLLNSRRHHGIASVSGRGRFRQILGSMLIHFGEYLRGRAEIATTPEVDRTIAPGLAS